jgi:hypothetical protein
MLSGSLPTFDGREMTDHATVAQHGADLAVRITSVSTYASATGTMYFGLTLNEIGVLFGILATVITLAANLIFQRKRDRREEELHRRKMHEGSREAT